MKKYTLTIEETEKGMHVQSINSGFNAFELLGLLSWKHDDVEKQISGEIEPDVVNRTVVKEQEETDGNYI